MPPAVNVWPAGVSALPSLKQVPPAAHEGPFGVLKILMDFQRYVALAGAARWQATMDRCRSDIVLVYGFVSRP